MPKRALIVGGGGMRGAHTAGVLAELSSRQIPNFDVVSACSAGACTSAFWIAEQHHLYERIWGDYLHDNRFIKFKRLLLPGPVMDLNYLLDEVFTHHEPLDTERILASPIDFFITATDCETGKAHYFHNKQDIDVLQALRCGAAIPFAYPLPVWYQGRPFADGGIVESIPIQKAIDEGCEEFLIILTRPKTQTKERVSRIPWPRWKYRHLPGLAEAMLKRHSLYNQQLQLIHELEQAGRAIVISPSESLPITRFTRNRSLLQRAMAEGHRDAASALEPTKRSN